MILRVGIFPAVVIISSFFVVLVYAIWSANTVATLSGVWDSLKFLRG